MLSRLINKVERTILYGFKGVPPTAVTDILLEKSIAAWGIRNYFYFDYNRQKAQTVSFVGKMHCLGAYSYKYAPSTVKPNIYSSVYACLILSLFGEIDKLNSEEKAQWVAYFDSFQHDDGFFYDETIQNELYENADWWGKRHLLPHIVMAYTALGAKPKHEFNWIKEFYDTQRIDELISEVRWDTAIMDDTDIDNKIMNIGVCLQYQRDFRNDESAGQAVSYLKEKLISKLNASTGFWGNYNLNDKAELARMIQFSYHLQRIFFYDNYKFTNVNRMIDLILSSQNEYGGFAVQLNSSACADIDAINPLIYLSRDNDYRTEDINKSLQRALIFVLSNQNVDGGFVFMRDVPFHYGAKEMTSRINESAMFPTWFRTQCLAYICNYIGWGTFKMIKCPGY